MADELKRAMEALEVLKDSAALGGGAMLSADHVVAILDVFREREQARKDEREACRLIAKMGHEEQCDCLVCHDVAAAIRARGER